MVAGMGQGGKVCFCRQHLIYFYSLAIPRSEACGESECLSDVLMCFLGLFELFMCNLLGILIAVQCCLLVLNSDCFDVSKGRYVLLILLRYQRTPTFLQVYTSNKIINEEEPSYHNKVCRSLLLMIVRYLGELVLELQRGIGLKFRICSTEKLSNEKLLFVSARQQVFVKFQFSLVFVFAKQTCRFYLLLGSYYKGNLQAFFIYQFCMLLNFCDIISCVSTYDIGLRKFLEYNLPSVCDTTKLKKELRSYFLIAIS